MKHLALALLLAAAACRPAGHETLRAREARQQRDAGLATLAVGGLVIPIGFTLALMPLGCIGGAQRDCREEEDLAKVGDGMMVAGLAAIVVGAVVALRGRRELDRANTAQPMRVAYEKESAFDFSFRAPPPEVWTAPDDVLRDGLALADGPMLVTKLRPSNLIPCCYGGCDEQLELTPASRAASPIAAAMLAAQAAQAMGAQPMRYAPAPSALQ